MKNSVQRETPVIDARRIVVIGRRDAIKRSLLLAGGVVIAGPALLSQEACGGNVITWAGTVINAFEQAQPIFADLLPGSVRLIVEALAVAKDLQGALKNKSADAITFLQQLIAPDGLFNKIAADVHLIQNEGERKIVSGVLALASIALSLIASGLQQGATQTGGPEMLRAAKSKSVNAVSVAESIGKSNRLEQALVAARF